MKIEKPNKAYQRVNVRKRPGVSEAGYASTKDVALWLDPRGTPTYVFALPLYVWNALGQQRWEAGNFGVSRGNWVDQLLRSMVDNGSLVHALATISMAKQWRSNV